MDDTRVFFWKFHVFDFLASVNRMNAEKRGCYISLLTTAWADGAGYLPDDDAELADICHVARHRWAKIKADVMRKFTLTERGWTHPDMLRDFQSACEKIAQNRAAGSRGGRSKALKGNGTGVANALARQETEDTRHESVTTNHKLESKTKYLESNNLESDSTTRARAYEEAKPEVSRTMPAAAPTSDPDDGPPSWQDEPPPPDSEDAYGYDDGSSLSLDKLVESAIPVSEPWKGLSKDAEAHLASIRERNARESAMQKESRAKEASPSRQPSSSEGLNRPPQERDWSDATHEGSGYVCRGTY